MTRSLPMVAGWVTAAVATVIAILAGGYIPTDPATLPQSLLGAALFGPGELPQVTRAIVAALVLGPYAWLLYKNRVVAIPTVRIMGAVGVLGLCLVAASLMSPYRYPALVSLAQWLVALGGLVALVALMGRGQGPPFLLAAITVAGGLLAMRGIMEYSAMKSIDPNWRIFGGYQNPNALAGVLAACVPVSVGLTSTLKRPINIMAAAWTLVLVMGVVLTQSRGGFLAMGVGLAGAAIVLAFQKDFRRAIGWIVPLLLAIALTVSLSNRDFGSGAPGAPGGRLANVQSTEAQSSGFRQNLWRSSAELIAQKPLGRGLGSFRYEVGKPGLVTQTVHAHQTYLQLAVEGGVLALLALLAVAWFWLRDTLKNAKSLTDERRLRLVGVVGGVIALGAQGMTETNLASFGPLWLLVALLAAGLCLAADGVSPEQAPPPFRLATALMVAVVPLIAGLWLAGSEVTRNGLFTRLMASPSPSVVQELTESGRKYADGDLYYYAGRLTPPGDAQVSHFVQSVNLLPSTRNLRALANAYAEHPGLDESTKKANATAAFDRALDLDPHNLTTLAEMLAYAERREDTAAIREIAERMIAVESTAVYRTRSLPEFVPTETADARVALARITSSPTEKRGLLDEALAIYDRYAKTTVPYLRNLVYNSQTGQYDESVTIAGESLRRAREVEAAAAEAREMLSN